MKIIKGLVKISLVLTFLSFMGYYYYPQIRFYRYHMIWLPSYCNEIKTIEDINYYGTKSSFKIEKSKIQLLVNSIDPQEIWILYNSLDSTMSDSTLHYPFVLPENVKEGKVKIILYNSHFLFYDYYNLSIKKVIGEDEIHVKISTKPK